MKFYLWLGTLAGIVASTATTGCYFLLLDEAEMPESLL